MSGIVLHAQRLDNGLELEFIDQSNRYYGDFYQVKVVVVSRLELTDELLAGSDLSERERLKLVSKFGAQLEARQELKRMGVAGPEVEAVTRQMVDQYLQTSLPYLATPNYPQRLLRTQLASQAKVVPLHG